MSSASALDALADAVAVRLAQAERLEHEHVEGALGQVGLLFRHGVSLPLGF